MSEPMIPLPRAVVEALITGRAIVYQRIGDDEHKFCRHCGCGWTGDIEYHAESCPVRVAQEALKATM